ncbi:glycosyltransferase family 2 protein [Planctomicrobium sp.]|nr:glycosyltransferase family 2 protein [Planctomicrobium sp.]MDA7527390.1 glycosyltransferase family 2 protein [bacterium]MDB4731457.1 glycosyltransferase family 2 protein [bacterium]MDB4733358.1 glycosyltransferase family 2 protein [Planctomicrobium sp.]
MKHSLVIPVFNEQETLPRLYQRVSSAAKNWDGDYEIICVDDGSTDLTSELLDDIHTKDPHWKKISFSRNFGHQAAVSAGMAFATGEVVGIIDGDLQDPPEMLQQMFAKWEDGYEVVYAVRASRKENIFKRIAYKSFYLLLQKCASIEIPLDAGDFCVMDRKVVDVVNSLPERTRFVRGLRTWAGFRQTGIEYDRDERDGGESKYTLSKLFALAFDGILGFSALPLRIASFLGIVFCFFAAMLIGALVVWRATDVTIFGMHPSQTMGWTSLVSIAMFLSGIQMLMLGIVGEYIARIFDEIKGRPTWIVSEVTGLTPSPDGIVPKPKSAKRFDFIGEKERASGL